MKEKKTYHCLMASFFDNGEVKVYTTMVSEEQKPENIFRNLNEADNYHDFYESKEEMEAWLAVYRETGAEVMA